MKTCIKTFTITKAKFIQWYFLDGQDSENESIRLDLADKLILGLSTNGEFKITLDNIFDDCNKPSIRLAYLEEFETNEENYDREICDLELIEGFTINLVD